jgi:hypothetical protein
MINNIIPELSIVIAKTYQKIYEYFKFEEKLSDLIPSMIEKY